MMPEPLQYIIGGAATLLLLAVALWFYYQALAVLKAIHMQPKAPVQTKAIGFIQPKETDDD